MTTASRVSDSRVTDEMVNAFRAHVMASSLQWGELGRRLGHNQMDRDIRTGLEAALSSQGEVEVWRPIETAPGREVDFQAWFKADDPRYESFWHPRCKLDGDGRVAEYGRVDYDIDDYSVRYGYTATHWMPVPTEPSDLTALIAKAQKVTK